MVFFSMSKYSIFCALSPLFLSSFLTSSWVPLRSMYVYCVTRTARRFSPSVTFVFWTFFVNLLVFFSLLRCRLVLLSFFYSFIQTPLFLFYFSTIKKVTASSCLICGFLFLRYHLSWNFFLCSNWIPFYSSLDCVDNFAGTFENFVCLEIYISMVDCTVIV